MLVLKILQKLVELENPFCPIFMVIENPFVAKLVALVYFLLVYVSLI